MSLRMRIIFSQLSGTFSSSLHGNRTINTSSSIFLLWSDSFLYRAINRISAVSFRVISIRCPVMYCGLPHYAVTNTVRNTTLHNSSVLPLDHSSLVFPHPVSYLTTSTEEKPRRLMPWLSGSSWIRPTASPSSAGIQAASPYPAAGLS